MRTIVVPRASEFVARCDQEAKEAGHTVTYDRVGDCIVARFYKGKAPLWSRYWNPAGGVDEWLCPAGV